MGAIMRDHQILKDKTIIVTGAATGIGQAFSIAASSYGAKIVVADINPGVKTVQLIKSSGGEAIYTKVDVSDEESTKSMAKAAIDWTGRIDGLINKQPIFVKSNLLLLKKSKWKLGIEFLM